METAPPPLYELLNVGKEFATSTETIGILKSINLRAEHGQTLAIIGASGSGKTTLLHLLGGLDRPSRGMIRFEGRELSGFDEVELARFRNRDIGFVFQFHHLLPEFDVLENTAMQGLIAGLDREAVYAAAEKALGLVGLSHRLRHKANTLSGGERQRAAIARAVLLKPKAILADEPTGNLDEGSGAQAAELLLRLNEELGTTLIVVTHNLALAGGMQRRLVLASGELHDETP